MFQPNKFHNTTIKWFVPLTDGADNNGRGMMVVLAYGLKQRGVRQTAAAVEADGDGFIAS